MAMIRHGTRFSRPPQRDDTAEPYAPMTAVGVLGACTFALWATAPAQPQRGAAPSTLELTNSVQITSSASVELSPTLAPDGRSVAYTSDEAGNLDIWVAPVGGRSPANLTSDHRGADQLPRWSPDDRQIAFWSNREGSGIYVVPVSGGAARKVAQTEYLAPAAWSADAAELAYVRRIDGQDSVEIQNLASGATRRVELAGGPGNQRLDLAWSPDGRLIAYVVARNYTAQVTRLWVQRLSNGKAVSITDARTLAWSPVWGPDSRTLYFASNQGGAMDVWHQRVDEQGAAQGQPARITSNLGAVHLSLSRDGGRLAYADFRRIGNVWQVPILSESQATWGHARQVTSNQAHIEFLAVSPDGVRLAISSDRGGNPDLWVMPIRGGTMQQVTNDPTPDWNPAWSPDGRELAFYAFRTGNREIWIQPAAGGNARRITRGEMESVNPTWSPDGKMIAFASPRAGNQDIWVVPAGGGEPRRLTSDEWGDTFPAWSPDGKWIAFTSGGPQGARIRRVPVGRGSIDVFTKGQGSLPTWSPDGKWLYFVSTRTGSANLWTISNDGQTERQLTNLSGKRGFMELNGIATDGRSLYFVWREDTGDIWVAGLSSTSKPSDANGHGTRRRQESH